MKTYSPLELAFLGDSIHTLYVRKWALENFDKPMNEINKICASKCSATHQSKVMSFLTLTDTEADIVRRARNAKAKHTAKNADVIEYKYATAFEALVAHLYLTNNNERLNEILEISIKEGI